MSQHQLCFISPINAYASIHLCTYKYTVPHVCIFSNTNLPANAIATHRCMHIYIHKQNMHTLNAHECIA